MKDECDVCKRHFLDLNVHHINGNHEDNSNDNLITLCGSCHSVVHQGLNVSRTSTRARKYKNQREIKLKLKKLRSKWLKEKYGK